MRARLAVVVGSWLVPALVGVDSAAAFTCYRQSEEAYLARSAAVFSGEVIAYEEVGDPLGWGTAVVTFAVDRVFKGKVEPEVKVGGGDPYIRPPRTGRFLIYADLIGTDRDVLQGQVVRLDNQLDDLQKPIREIEARLHAAPDPVARAQHQTARDVEANRISAQRETLIRAKNDLTEQMRTRALRGVQLVSESCSWYRPQAQTSDVGNAGPIPASFGKGVAPRGIDTDAPPPPRTSFGDRLAPWWPVGLGASIFASGLGSWILTHRRRGARSAGDTGSTP